MVGAARVAIIGGSVAGLTTALLLRDLGLDVTVYERSAAELEQRGAGIGFLPTSYRYLVERAGVDLDEISTSTTSIRYLDRQGDDYYNYTFVGPFEPEFHHGVPTLQVRWYGKNKVRSIPDGQLETYASANYLDASRTVRLDREEVPQLEDVNVTLRRETGFSMRPVWSSMMRSSNSAVPMPMTIAP